MRFKRSLADYQGFTTMQRGNPQVRGQTMGRVPLLLVMMLTRRHESYQNWNGTIRKKIE